MVCISSARVSGPLRNIRRFIPCKRTHRRMMLHKCSFDQAFSFHCVLQHISHRAWIQVCYNPDPLFALRLQSWAENAMKTKSLSFAERVRHHTTYRRYSTTPLLYHDRHAVNPTGCCRYNQIGAISTLTNSCSGRPFHPGVFEFIVPKLSSGNRRGILS